MKLTITEGNSKIGACLNFSFPPVVSCAAGIPCAKECYAVSICKRYTSTRKLWQDNYALYLPYQRDFCDQLYVALTKWRRKGRQYVRFFVSGDFPDSTMQDVIINAALDYPALKFMSYTKRYDLDWAWYGKPNRDLTPNLMIRWSSWPGWEQPRPAGLTAETEMLPKGVELPEGGFLCPGFCDDCGHKCWHSEQKIYIRKH
jgi:hypothetical protein